MSEPRHGTRLRDAQKTRLAILDAASDAFAERGFAGARVSAIAAAAGVPAGLIYHHFHSKRDLFEAAIARAFTPLTDELRGQFAAPAPTYALFEELVRRYFRMLIARPRVARMAAWWYASLGWMESPRPAHEMWAVKASAVELVRRVRDAGGIRASLDPEGVVLTVLALCQHWAISHGENLHLLAIRSHEDPHETRLAQILETLGAALRP